MLRYVPGHVEPGQHAAPPGYGQVGHVQKPVGLVITVAGGVVEHRH